MIGRAFVAGKAIIENATLLHPRFISIRLGTLIKLKKTSKLFLFNFQNAPLLSDIS